MLLTSFFPLAILISAVLVSILFGWATPTESAALGAVGTFALAALYRGMSWELVTESLKSTLKTTVMMFMILSRPTRGN